jgi:predicted Fe-Mo cluster-binding NifX family protein
MRMKVAVATDDSTTISHHFGRALGFMVYEIEGGKIVEKEYRENVGKHTGECGSCNHSAMIQNIEDCEFVISHGMGRRIYNDLIAHSINPVVTDQESVDDTIDLFIKNQLRNRIDKLH